MRWFTLLLVGCVSVQAAGAVINVPADQATIQAAINVAVNGDEIIVAPGTYVETINFLGKAITVRSTDPNDPAVVQSTIIDGNGAGSVVTCASGEGAGSVLSGFVITGGSGKVINSQNTYGGGMYNLNSSPTVTNCSFSGNSAVGVGGFLGEASGGGMYNLPTAAPTVTNCTFIGNSVTAASIDISGNASVAGGGMFIGSGSTTITDSEFCGNAPDNVIGSFTDGGGNEFSVSCPPPIPGPAACPADITGDTNVNVTDLLALLAAWGACP